MTTSIENAKSIYGEVNYAFITIREDEAKAILDRINFDRKCRGIRTYDLAAIKLGERAERFVAHIRCPGSQGPSEARETASILIRDLAPRWVIVVGIAGSIPNEDVTLGDVVVSSSLYDSRMMASNPSGSRSFALNKEKLHQKARDFIAQLPSVEKEIGEWHSARSISIKRPKINIRELTAKGGEALKGSNDWQKRLRDSLNIHFGPNTLRPAHPLVHAVPFMSGSELVKDPAVTENWLGSARDFKAIEMELIGVYEACTSFPVEGNNVPLLSIRGISDIVGLTRQPEWTQYACHSAAAFAVALISSGVLEPNIQAGQVASRPHNRSTRKDKDKAEELLKLGRLSITPKLVSSGGVDPVSVFTGLAKKTLSRSKVLICWNVRPVPHLGIIHLAYLQQLSRLAKWGFRIRVVIYDVCTSHQHGEAQLNALVDGMVEKIRRFEGLFQKTNIVRVSQLLKNKNATEVISELFNLARPSLDEDIQFNSNPFTSLDNLLGIAVERWMKPDILLAGGRDANDFWANYRSTLSKRAMRSDHPSLILDFPKISIGQTVRPEASNILPYENDSIESIAEKLQPMDSTELETIWNVLFWPYEGQVDLSVPNLNHLAYHIHDCFRSSPYLRFSSS